MAAGSSPLRTRFSAAASSGCGFSLSASDPSSACRSGPLPTMSTVGFDPPAALKISPNSTMNMRGNANVKKNAGRSRENMRTLAW